MAVFKGTAPTPAVQARGNLRSTNMNSTTQNQTLGRAQVLQRSLANKPPVKAPVNIHGLSRGGALYAQLLALVYGRIHVSQNLIDLGSVLSEQEASVSVWNAYFANKQLTDIHVNPVDELTLFGQSAPAVLGPLAEFEYKMRVPAEGPATINVFVAWTFGAEIVSLNLTGSRIAFWSFLPTWEGGIRERLEWYTGILTSPLGIEQRRSLRESPRRFFELQLIAKPDERSYMELSCFDWGARRWAIPIWTDVQTTTADIAEGSMFIACSTANRDFYAGGLVALRGVSAFDYEVSEILRVEADGLVLSRPLNNAWRKNTRVYPVRVAQFTEQPQFTRLTVNSATVRAQFQIVEPSDWPAEAPATMYRGKPVYLDPPEESQSLTASYQRLLEMMDNRRDNPRMGDSAGIAFTAQGHRWQVYGRAAQARMRRLWYFLRGRFKSVWIPTFSEDLIVNAPMAPGSLLLQVRNTGYVKFGKMHPGRKDVMVVLRDGRMFFRRIMEAIEVEGGEALTLDSSLGLTETLPAEDVVRVSFIALCRMDQDFIEITHETDSDGLMSANTIWRSLRDDLGDV